MNARLYDPLVGRFLNADPYIQAPDFTQAFNRYSYALNNPLKYTDETGEYTGVDDLIAALIGGTINWATNGCLFSWQGLLYFGIGSAEGVGSLYVSPLVAAGLAAGANSIVSQGFGPDGKWNGENIDFSSASFAAILGAATAYLGGQMSEALSSSLGIITDKIPGKAWAGMINQGVTGFVTGASISAGVSVLNQYGQRSKIDWDEVWNNAIQSGLNGLALGAVSGTADGILKAHEAKENPWKWRSENIVNDANNHYSVYVGTDPFTGDVKYVGMTGRELDARVKEHRASKTNRSNLNYDYIQQGMSKIEARIYEQTTINQYGIQNLYNKINSIAPKYWNKYNIKP